MAYTVKGKVRCTNCGESATFRAGNVGELIETWKQAHVCKTGWGEALEDAVKDFGPSQT